MRPGTNWVKSDCVTVKGNSSEDEPWLRPHFRTTRVPNTASSIKSVQLAGEAVMANFKRFSLGRSICPARGACFHDAQWTRDIVMSYHGNRVLL